jgi:hypothetical protein
MEFTTKYWVIVMVVALVLLLGSGALAVWICKIYDTQTPPSLPPAVSPFPDVVPIVIPPSVDPVLNNCYKWCGTTLCEDSKVTCTRQQDCDDKCTVPNSVTKPAVCKDSICGPQMQTCITNFPLSPGTDMNNDPISVADASNLKTCFTNTDCNVCQDTPQGEQMNCVFVENNSTVNLSNFQVQSIPQGYYCLPQRTGCDAHSGIATWTDQGWSCACNWSDVMGGPECNILLACKNNEVTSTTKQLQQLIVNCNDSSNPWCGNVWTPDSLIDPKGYYNKTNGFGSKALPGDANALPNCVCQCDGTQENTYKGFTYDLTNPLTCQLDSCNNSAWGRTLIGDAGYLVNAVPGLLYSLQVISPVQNQYLSLKPKAFLALTATLDTKVEMLVNGQLVVYNGTPDSSTPGTFDYSKITVLATNEAGSQVGSQESFTTSYADGLTWVFKKIPGLSQRPDNLDNLVLYNPSGSRPEGAQFTDPIYNDDKRYLVYDSSTSIFSLGSLENNNVVVFQRVDGTSINNPKGASSSYISQPMTNCACSGANSMSSIPACFDSNDNFVGIKSLMNVTDWDTKCDSRFTKNISAICDSYTIPKSVITIAPDVNSKILCDLYEADLKTLVANTAPTVSTNLLPNRSGFVPGLGLFINDLSYQEELRSVCTADPCTGKYGDPSFSLQNNSGNWDALLGQCACENGNIDDLSANYYSFPVDTLTQRWDKSCATDNTSTNCVCNHIVNPVCGVCQNACHGTSPCMNSKPYPCMNPSNLSCKTDPKSGGPMCVCENNCILTPGQGQQMECMQQIPTGGLCDGLVKETNVCVDSSAQCLNKAKNYSYTDILPSPFGGDVLNFECKAESGIPTPSVTFCSTKIDSNCFDSTSPENGSALSQTHCRNIMDICPS